MRTFAELLTAYTARTGISDAELARTLGVSRQTIFRWKEGLVDKPRHRADVLRCAARLRLTAEERDALLLAAGFAPESAQSALSTTPSVRVEVESEPEQAPFAETAGAPAMPAAEPETDDAHFRGESGPPGGVHHPSKAAGSHPVLRRAILAVALLVLLVALGGGAGFFLSRRGAGPTYPAAGPGETLIVVGSFGSSAGPQGEGSPPQDSLARRVQAALEREIQAARLDHVRVAAWPERIGDDGAAESVRRRAGAGIVLGGTQDAGDERGELLLLGTAGSTDGVALRALVRVSSGARMRIAVTSADEVRALALLILARVQTEREELGKAAGALTLALSNPPADPQTLATLYLHLGYVYHVSQPPEVGQAVDAYGKAIDLSESPEAHLNRGLAYVYQAESARWQSALTRALALRPDYPEARLALCWAYALDLQPELALPHCDAAVSREPTGPTREARGIVYAELGRLAEAAAELQSFLDWLARQPESVRARHGTAPAERAQALKAGRNPIDRAALEALRRR